MRKPPILTVLLLGAIGYALWATRDGAKPTPAMTNQAPATQPQALAKVSSPQPTTKPKMEMISRPVPTDHPPIVLHIGQSVPVAPDAANSDAANADVAASPAPTEVVIPEPMAREALAFVGSDSQAEEVWATAINDPNLPPDARQNLIEDLNETGFADPKNITMDDLPLIESRIALIEDLAPDAMDDVNEAAFEEAYKDLQDMRAKLVGP